ncbi:hypothetical protein BH20ACT24_BH20ACT24_20910 [soil metagenome]
MSTYRVLAPQPARAASESVDRSPPSAVALGPLTEDVRETLRTGWIDPAVRAASTSPMFLTAAWSAIRPNVGRSFAALARALRQEAADSVSARPSGDLLRSLEIELPEGERRWMLDAARAAHMASAKSQMVAHLLHRLARRDRLRGTGSEEPTARRGVPEWQRWMSFQPIPAGARTVLEDAVTRLGAPAPPPALRLFARWPAAATRLWQELVPVLESESWRPKVLRLRNRLAKGIETLPHAVELQWPAVRARGVSESERLRLVGLLSAHDAAMPAYTLIAAFAWVAVGAPGIGPEG